MKQLVHVTERFSRSGGGLPAVVASHMAWQAQLGWKVTLLHSGAVDAIECSGGRSVCCPPTRLGAAWQWSPELGPRIEDAIADGAELVHLHGLWTAPQAVASRIAQARKLPIIITFHGQLSARSLGQGMCIGALKKRAYLGLIGNDVVRRAAILHAITTGEADTIRERFPNSSIEVVPNFIDTDALARQLSVAGITASERGREILYLGRLDKRKGVIQLLHAFAHANLPNEWRLRFVGPDDQQGMRQTLQRLAASYRIEERIEIGDPVYGQEKLRLLCGATVVCMPSFDEVIGMVNLEAAFCAKLVVTTPYTGLEGWQEAGGVMTEPSVVELAKTLSRVGSMSNEERTARGLSLKNWVSHFYGLTRIRQQWIELYGRSSA